MTHAAARNRRGTEPIIEPSETSRKAPLRTGEVALLVAVAALAAIAWANPSQVPLHVRAGLLVVGGLFAVAALALADGRGTWRYWMRELLPVPLVPFVFLSCGRLIPLVNGKVFDTQLERWDLAILGRETQAALYTIPIPAMLADLLTVAYSTFFFLPVALLITLCARRDPYLPRVASSIILTFVISYAGYFIVPAYGPRATVARERYKSLPAGVVGAPIRDLLDNWETTKTDAFPSGHTMVTLAVLYCARRRHRRLYVTLLPIGSLLIAATVLLTFHWLVDVLAAVPLAVGSLVLAAAITGAIPRLPRGAPGA